MNKTKIMLALLALATMAMPMGSAETTESAGNCVGDYDYDNDVCTGYCDDIPPGENCRGVCSGGCMLALLVEETSDESEQQRAEGECIGIYDSNTNKCTGYETGTCTTLVPERTIYNPLTGNSMGTYGGQQFCL